MAAGLVTPTEAGMGPSVLGIAASIGAKIRDAAQDAKEQREKAAEKGETPKKGSLFKSSLANQFNPIKSKKAKSNWAKQFDWNKKTQSDQQVKPPTGEGGGDSKGKLKEFIAGGFTAILKDTGMMVSKLDGVKTMTGENLAEVTRASSSLTVIKDSIDAQTELRRKALEEAKYARTEKKLEKTSDTAGLSAPKQPEEKKDGEGGDGGDGGGGPFDWIKNIFSLDNLFNILGVADIASNIPGKWLQKLNPFKKSPVTQGGGGKPPGLRMPGAGPRVTTSGGAPAARAGGNWLSRLMPKGIGGAATRFGLGRIAQGAMGLASPIGWGMLGGEVLGEGAKLLGQRNRDEQEKKRKELELSLGIGSPSETSAMTSDGSIPKLIQRDVPWWEKLNPFKMSEGGIVPSAVPPSPVSPMAEGGVVDNPTKTNLNPGDSVIPLNRSFGKKLIGDKPKTTPSETAIDTVGAMILGVSAGMLGKTDSGTVGDQVKQNIRKASKEFGISNLTFTSPIGRAQFGKVDPNKTAKDFMASLFDGIQIAGGKGKKSGGGDKDNPPGGTPESLKGDLEADIGKDASQMKEEIMQSGATGIVDPTQQPWCAAYVNSQLKRQGIQGSGSALADSFEKWGAPVDKSNIQYGDVIVGDYGGGSRSHVMFAAGSPKDGAVEIIGGNQSGKVTRGSIALDKIDYVRRAGAQPPALPTQRNNGKTTPPPAAPTPQPAPNPNNKPAQANLPTGTVSPLYNWNKKPEAEDGMVGPSWLPWNWGKVADKGRNEMKIGYNARYNNVTDPEMRRMMGLPPLKGYASGGKSDVMKANAAKLKAQRASQQRARLGVQKVNGKWVNMGVSDRAVGGNPWWQVWNKKGATAERKAKQEALAKNLAERLNKQEAAKLKPKPAPAAPARQPSSSGGTRPAPSKPQSATPAVVMPPASTTKISPAAAVGSFGSAVPSAKTSAMVFADFLYPDLV